MLVFRGVSLCHVDLLFTVWDACGRWSWSPMFSHSSQQLMSWLIACQSEHVPSALRSPSFMRGNYLMCSSLGDDSHDSQKGFQITVYVKYIPGSNGIHLHNEFYTELQMWLDSFSTIVSTKEIKIECIRSPKDPLDSLRSSTAWDSKNAADFLAVFGRLESWNFHEFPWSVFISWQNHHK